MMRERGLGKSSLSSSSAPSSKTSWRWEGWRISPWFSCCFWCHPGWFKRLTPMRIVRNSVSACGNPAKKLQNVLIGMLDVFFRQIKSFIRFFWAPDPLIIKFYKNLWNKWSEAQKQRINEISWMIWFDEKMPLRYVQNIFFCQHLMRAYSTHVMNSEALFIFLYGLVTIRKWPIILLLNHLLHMPYIRLYMKTVYYIGTDLGIILFLVL